MMEVETPSQALIEITAESGSNKIIENGGSPEPVKDSTEFAVPAPSAVSTTPVSTPDLTPSRRSSRKKQSTFSSDFEYYTPGGRKIVAVDEDKQDTPNNKTTPKGGKNVQTGEGNVAATEKIGGMQRKVAIRTKKVAASKDETDKDEESEDEEEETSPSPKSKVKKTKLKVAVKKQKDLKGQKKKAQKVKEEKKQILNKLNKSLKRKKAAIKTALGKGKKARLETKKAKVDSSEEDDDEDDSTPISQLKAQMAAAKSSPAKVKTKNMIKTPLAMNLMKKLKQVSNEVLSSPESLSGAKKRKLAAEENDEDDGDDDIPLKKLQTADAKNKDDQETGVKRSPPDDLGLVKRTPSEIAVKLGTVSKKEGVNSAKPEASGDGTVSSKKKETAKIIKKEAGDASHSLEEGKKKIKQEEKAGKSSKKDVKKEDGKVDLKTPAKIKKDTDVIKTVQRTITTQEGKVINAVVKVYRDGKKVMTINGKEKILNPGKSKSATTQPKTPDKSDAQVKTKSDEKPSASKKIDGKIKSEEGKAAGNKDQKKKIVETNQKQGKKVDDLLKRGILVKKKSHQPFGNKNSVSKHHKASHDTKEEVADKCGEVKKKVSPSKLGEKKERKRSHEGERKKIGETERRRSSSESSKSHAGRDRSQSLDSSKGEKRKSTDGNKKGGQPAEKLKEEVKEEEIPTLVPISAMTKHHNKHKHPKPEHEVPMDMTMNDLFKPDGLIMLDTPKKEDGAVVAADEDKKDVAVEPDSPVKPQNLPNVLIEHRYSKPSSPVNPDSGEGLSLGLRQQDFDSVSHNTSSVTVDSSLPDQFMEESGSQESETTSSDGHPSLLQDCLEGLQQGLLKEKAADRTSILESLDTELKEGGSEFLIVGQVEIERPLVLENAIASLQQDDLKKVKESAVAVTPSKNDEPKKKTVEQSKVQKAGKDSGESKKKEKRKDTKKKGNENNENEEGANDDDGGEEEEEGFVDDENDDDWEPDDPNTLYCICQKPHGNRFMICCDKCEEWYHGSCVGISKSRGKEMEDNEEDYICLVCQKNETTQTPVKSVEPATKSIEKTTPTKPKLPQKCVGRKCSKTPRPGSVYCSNECIMSHAQESIKIIREEQYKRKIQEKSDSKHGSGSKMSSFVSDYVAVMEADTGRIIQGPDAPTHKTLRQWLEDHPTFQVLNAGKNKSSISKDSKHRDSHSSKSGDKEKYYEKDSKHSDKSRRDSKDAVKKVDGERRRSSSSSSKPEGPSSSSSSASSSSSKMDGRSDGRGDDGPNQVRLNVRTALRDSLSARAKNADDIMLSGSEIKTLALTIEEQLFAHFNDTGHKYRTKYRSLIFNIKDQKNKGLFRKILTGKIKPSKLVQMSTEELASRELAKWREKESKHQLEMIEQTEKEAAKKGLMKKPVTKKTHKGEVEVEEEDLSILGGNIDDDVSKDTTDDGIQIPIVDTTDQHRAHLFDLNCKVCTGKIVPGPEEQQAAAKKQVTFSLQASSTKIISDDEDHPDDEVNDFDKAEEIVREAMRTVQKTAAEVASSSSSISTISSFPAEDEPRVDENMPLSPKPAPPLSPSSVLKTSSSSAASSHRESSSSSSTPTSSSPASQSAAKKVIVRSPDSALQSGLEVKAKFTPTGPLLWKGFVSMLDVAKFFTSAYRVSGPTDHITIPDTIHIMGRISPDHMWDYLSKIRQAGSKDLTVLRFIPGSDDEKVTYVHLYSYLNSRGRCGVANNPNKHIKDFYVVPLASHSKIPRTLLPFDGPGLEENRPHMLIGILVQQRGKHSSADTDSSSSKKSSSSSSSSSSKSSSKRKSSSSSSSSSSNKKPVVSRDPRLAKLAAKEPSPKASPTGSNSSSASSSNHAATPVSLDEKAQDDEEDIYEPEYVPMPMKAKAEPVAEYVPTLKRREAEGRSERKEKRSEDSSSKHHHHHHHHHHSQNQHRLSESQHHHHHKEEKSKIEDDSEPYSPGKEAEPYSPGREAEADEPYDPGDESLLDEGGVPINSMSTVLPPSSTTTSAITTTSEEMSHGTPCASGGLGEVDKKLSNSDQKTDQMTGAAASFSIEECVEKMACSNNPSEISSLMVAALSKAASPEEQQALLVDLTKRVEERKIQLAQMSTKSGGGNSSASKRPIEEGSVSSTSSALDSLPKLTNVGTKSEDDSAIKENSSLSRSAKGVFSVSSSSEVGLLKSRSPKEDSQIAKEQIETGSVFDVSSLLVSSTSSSSSKSDSSKIKFSFLKPADKSQPTNKDLSSDSKGKSNQPEEQTTLHQVQSSFGDQTMAKELSLGGNRVTGESSSSKPGAVDIPYALKALIEDVKGNTDSFSLEPRRKTLLRREMEHSVGDGEKGNSKTDADGPITGSPGASVESQASEMQRKLQDELEARKILEELNESEKAIGMPGGGKKEEVAPSSSPASTTKPDVAKETATPSSSSSSSEKVPTIDELLAKLKKEGFKFPVQDTIAASSSSLSSSSVIPSSATNVSTANSGTSAPVTPSTQVHPSTLSADSSIFDVDLRSTATPSMSTPTLTPTPTPSDTISMTISMADNEAHPALSIQSQLGGNDQRIQRIGTTTGAAVSPIGGPLDQDERGLAIQDRDERVQMQTPKPRHPLDPRAFPPLPPVDAHRQTPTPPSGDPRTLAAVASSSSIHPQQYPVQPVVVSQARPLPLPKSRAQPPPPGTELDEPSEPLDVDMRSMSGARPLLGPSSEQQQQGPPPLPPQPPQPPPPLPPLPGNRLTPHYPPHFPPASHDYPQAAADVDFRSHEHHHHGGAPPPPHHHHQQHHHHHPHPPPHHPHPHSQQPQPRPHRPDNWYHDRGRDTDFRGFSGRGRGGASHPYRRH